MAKIGSEFLKEFSHFEKPSLFKSPKRLVIFIIGIILMGAISIALIFLGFPQIILYILAVPVLLPLTVYGTGKDDEFKERLLRYLSVRERSYQTNYDNRKGDLTQDDFKGSSKTQESETD